MPAKSVMNFRSLISIPMAIFDIDGVLLIKFIKVSARVSGMLSTQKNPLSSKALSATVFPEPESPVRIMVNSSFFFEISLDRFYKAKVAVVSFV